MKLSRDAVVEAALELVDGYGLGDLTMRRLAAELGAQPGALYWHVDSKQALLAAMAERIVAGVAPPQSGDWRTDLHQLTADFRTVMLNQRDGAEVVAAGLALRPGSGEPLETMIKIIAGAGFDDVTSRAAAAALLHQVLGHATEVQSHDQLRLAAVTGDASDRRDEARCDFTVGVTVFLDGLAAWLDEPP